MLKYFYNVFIAWKFLFEGKLQTALILVATSLGVTVMIFLTALITGLQQDLIARTLGSQPHVVVRAPEDLAFHSFANAHTDGSSSSVFLLKKEQLNVKKERALSQWQQVEQTLWQIPEIVAVAPLLTGNAFLEKENTRRAVVVRGIQDSYFKVIPFESKIVAGNFLLNPTSIVIGKNLAEDWSITVGDKVRIFSTSSRVDTFVVSGIFDLGNKDINERWVFMSLSTAQFLFDRSGEITSLDVRVSDPFIATQIAQNIESRLRVRAESWMQINETLMTALQSQSSSSMMIQFFVVLAVALGIASVLIVSVVQKSKEIGIMKATGTSSAQILKIFVYQGIFVAVCGFILGSFLGAGLTIFFRSVAVNPDGTPKFPLYLPVELFIKVFLLTLFVGILSAFLPARRAARLDPVVAIRGGN